MRYNVSRALLRGIVCFYDLCPFRALDFFDTDEALTKGSMFASPSESCHFEVARLGL
jgi:hypothetical protein